MAPAACRRRGKPRLPHLRWPASSRPTHQPEQARRDATAGNTPIHGPGCLPQARQAKVASPTVAGIQPANASAGACPKGCDGEKHAHPWPRLLAAGDASTHCVSCVSRRLRAPRTPILFGTAYAGRMNRRPAWLGAANAPSPDVRGGHRGHRSLPVRCASPSWLRLLPEPGDGAPAAPRSVRHRAVGTRGKARGHPYRGAGVRRQAEPGWRSGGALVSAVGVE